MYKNESPLIRDKCMQLFSDLEIMPRKNATQQEFEKDISPHAPNIVAAVEAGMEEVKELCKKYERSFQNKNFKANNLNSFVQGFISNFISDCKIGDALGKRFYIEIKGHRLFFKKVNKKLLPSNIKTRQVELYNNQETDVITDDSPITYIGYQVDKTWTKIKGIYAVHINNHGQVQWYSDIVDLACNSTNNTINMTNTMEYDEVRVTVKEKKEAI